ncbi:MAG: metallophosphoesterase [Gemmataceae bacterium]|nr:metallophosphoesterase [Gemmataceae bacterium]
MAGRTIAVGDIHGCSAALAAVLDAVAPGPADTVVTLGDHINRGPDTRGVLDQLIALAGRCKLVPRLGNHEEVLLDALRDIGHLRRWLNMGGPTPSGPTGGSSAGRGGRWPTGYPSPTASSWPAAGTTTRRPPTCSSTPATSPSCRWPSNRGWPSAGGRPNPPRPPRIIRARWPWSGTPRNGPGRCWTWGSWSASTRTAPAAGG